LKQSVSPNETKCFTPRNEVFQGLKLFLKPNRLQVKRWWSCCPSPANSLFIEETEKRWKRRWKDELRCPM